MEYDNTDKLKQELIIKVSTIENNMIEKIDYQRMQEDSYSKLQSLFRNEEEKNKELVNKYNQINNDFQELKNRCQVMFVELEEKKGNKNSDALEIIRLKKEIMVCR